MGRVKDYYIDECHRLEQEKVFLDWINEEYGVERSTEACELLGSTIDENTDTYEEVLEVTINFPKENLLLLQHIECYKQLWADLKTHLKSVDDLYFVEYCKSGQAHIHGYIKFKLIPNMINISDNIFLDSIVRFILKKLPKKFWKMNVKKLQFNEYYRMAKCPAVCLNLKNTLSSNWIQYIKKNT